jgi:hypothetical protein
VSVHGHAPVRPVSTSTIRRSPFRPFPPQDEKVPGEPGSKEAEAYLWSMPHTCIELTHNHGTEKVLRGGRAIKRRWGAPRHSRPANAPSLDVSRSGPNNHSRTPNFPTTRATMSPAGALATLPSSPTTSTRRAMSWRRRM